MRQHPQGWDAAKCYAPASSRRTANLDHGTAEAPAARALLDFGKVLRSGTALTLQRRAARTAAPNRDSSGLLIAAALRGPSPGQKFVELLHGPTVDELCEDVGQISLRVELIEFCCLCRPSNYAEEARFPQDSW